MTQQLVKVNQKTGNFNLANPDETQTIVRITIREIAYDERFTYPEGKIDVRNEPWDVAIEEVCHTRTGYVGWSDNVEKLDRYLKDNRDRIRAKWEEHRAKELDERIQHLKEEKRRLE